MSIFINNIPVSINFFSPFTPRSKDKPLAVVLIQLGFENSAIQHNWTFTLGLGLVLNNASSFDITMRHINKCYVKCKYNKCKFCCCVPHTKHFMMICRWNPLTSHHRPENNHKRQCICQIKHEKMRGVRSVFQICLFYTS